VRRGAAIAIMLTTLAAIAALPIPSFAQALRDIPADAPRGRMTHLTELQVELDGRQALLATNVRIIGTTNLTMVPGAIPPGSIVRYRLDADRAIDRVWILTPEEAVAIPARPR